MSELTCNLLPLRFKRQELYEESARILGKELAEHVGYSRENDGSWIVSASNGERFCTVPFLGKAKRGQAWNAPDPDGMRRAELIVKAVNAHEELIEALIAARAFIPKNQSALRNKINSVLDLAEKGIIKP